MIERENVIINIHPPITTTIKNHTHTQKSKIRNDKSKFVERVKERRRN